MAATAVAPAGWLLHLADCALVLGQRNAQWCGHGPVLEEDIALTNISLDLVGQARLLYQHAAAVINADAASDAGPPGKPGTACGSACARAPLGGSEPHAVGERGGHIATEDSLAYLRDGRAFKNFTLLELPHHGPLAATGAADRDYATTIVRNFLYSQFMLGAWQALAASADTQLAAIAGRSVKEVGYHLRHARDWLVRLGDGTDESHARAQAAVNHLLPYTQEFWLLSADDEAALANGTGYDAAGLRPVWDAQVDAALAEATLRRPPAGGAVPQGKLGLHSEHLGFLLAEMQGLARQHPGARW